MSNTPHPLRIVIHGASGRMGQALLRLSQESSHGVNVVAAVRRQVSEGTRVDGIPYYPASALADLPDFDVAIDFSLPEGFDAMLALCVQRGAALVSGTTGLSANQQAALQVAAQKIPLVWATNFSLGVAVLTDLVQRAARLLNTWDCDIVEAHHTRKLDAPSGTALTLGEAAQTAGVQPHYASLRAGDIVGEHTVQFAGQGERIELVHRATNRDIFARGALHVAAQLAQRPAGRYQVAELL